MVQKAKLPEGTDEIRDARHVCYDDIACDYDQEYGLEDYNALCAEERQLEEMHRLELAARNRQAELALKQEHDGPAMVAQANNKPIGTVVPAKKAGSAMKIVYMTAKETTQKQAAKPKQAKKPLGWALHINAATPSPRFKELVKQAEENYDFNERQRSFRWYNQEKTTESISIAIEDAGDWINRKIAVVRPEYY